MKIGDTGKFKDQKDGQEYNWKVLKDGKMWMTQNYNYKSPRSICYDNKESNATKYGRLYDLKEARDLAPEGWRLPDRYEDFDKICPSYEYSSGDPKPIIPGGESGVDFLYGGAWRSHSKEFFGMGESIVYWTSSYGSSEGELASWDFHIYMQIIRGGKKFYTVQGAHLEWKNKCAVRYVKNI